MHYTLFNLRDVSKIVHRVCACGRTRSRI
jgi:hypothetical protein